MQTVSFEKTEIRANIKSLIKTYKSEELNTFSKNICARLDSIVEEYKIRKVGVFAPTEAEPNIWPFIEHTRAQTYFPKLVADHLDFFPCTSMADMQRNWFGILEPKADTQPLVPTALDAILVPGLAFDRLGHRLGRGKGYYDRFLARLPKAVKRIGVCFPFQLIKLVPTEHWDQRVDLVVSE